MEKHYYHITTPNKALNILKNGLKCNEEGEIFLFENKTLRVKEEYRSDYERLGLKTEIVVVEHIARNQVFLKDIVMLEIDSKGLYGELIQDKVGEATSEFQWIVKQPLIAPEFIEEFGHYHLD